MEVVPEPNTVSDHIKTFLGDPQWPKYIKDSQLNLEANFFEYKIMLEIFLVNYNCS